MDTLAKLGFSQSYTYFTWRNTRAELDEYVSELGGADRLVPAQLLRQHARHPPRVPAGGRAARRSRRAPCSRRRCRRRTACTPASSAPRTSPSRPGQRGVPRLREVRVRARARSAATLSPLVRRCNEIRRASRRVPPRRQRHLPRHRARRTCSSTRRAAARRGHRVREPRSARVRRGPRRRCPTGARPRRTRSTWSTSSPATGTTWRVGGNYVRLPPGGAHVMAVR